MDQPNNNQIVLPLLAFYFCSVTHLPFIPPHFSLAVFILMQLYCLYCTDEGHCIVTETFDTNLRNYLVAIWLVRERKN